MVLKWTFLLPFLLLVQFDNINGEGSELPGHMQPLGSHRPPIKVTRIQHLPTPAEFHRDYVTPKVPVVMEGALNGASAWKKWQNDDYLRSDDYISHQSPLKLSIPADGSGKMQQAIIYIYIYIYIYSQSM